MSTLYACDKCRAKQNRSNKADGWTHISMYTEGAKKLEDIKGLRLSVDLCPKCSDKITRSLKNILKNK